MKLSGLNRYFLLFILLAAVLVRLAGISWGLPFPFHPDEWNMAVSVGQLSWQEGLNPHFFAYGQFPLYLTYFSAKAYNLLPWINQETIFTSEAILFLRFWSAVAGTFSVYLVYLISKRLFATNYALLAALLAAFIPGLIQNSHFGTTESILTLGFLGVVYCSLRILDKPDYQYYLLLALFLAMALGSKITALVFFTPLFLAFLYQLIRSKSKRLVFLLIGSLSLTLALTIIFSPHLLFSWRESKHTLDYEIRIARGVFPVFYTRQFIDTLPIIFQLRKIFPFALGWPLFIIGASGFVFWTIMLIKSAKSKKISQIADWRRLIIAVSFVIYFFSQAFLFTKWTRFMAPVFPFFAIFAVPALQCAAKMIASKKTAFVFYSLVGTAAIIPGLIFSTIYLKPDIRFVASEWIYKNIPSGSKILSETGNVVDLPVLPPNHTNPPPSVSYLVVSFDFYHLDENPRLLPELLEHLKASEYIFVPSRRIFANHLRHSEKYPLVSKYYELLFSGKLGFREIKVFQPFKYRFFDDEQAEETLSVFDHPVIRIYQKEKSFTQKEYEELFKN